MTALRRVPAALGVCAGVLLCASWAMAQETVQAAPVGGGTPAATTSAAKPVTEEGGWNTQYGLLFELNNIFQVDDILSEFEGGIGLQYHLDPLTAVRVGLHMYRYTNPTTITKNTTKTGNDTVVTYNVNHNSPTAQSYTALTADYLMRMSPHHVAPYYGGGLALSWNRWHTKDVDDVTVPDQKTTINNHSSTKALGARGIFGIGWRIYDHFELFAEYNLGVNLMEVNRSKSQTTVENEINGAAATVQTTSETDYTRWLNYSLGLEHGGAFGVIAYF